MWRKKNLVHCWWECELVQTLWKTAWRFLKKLRIELPYDPAIPLLGIYLKNWKPLFPKIYAPPYSLQRCSQYPRRGNNLSVLQRMAEEKERWFIETTEYYSAIKNDENSHLQQHGCILRVSHLVNKIRQTGTDENHMISLR